MNFVYFFLAQVDITTHGQQMLHNFLMRISGMIPNYTMECRKEGCIKYIRDMVGTSQVLVLVSGGVDSTVCAALLTRALNPNQIHAVHIDNGKKENLPLNCIYRITLTHFWWNKFCRIFAKR